MSCFAKRNSAIHSPSSIVCKSNLPNSFMAVRGFSRNERHKGGENSSSSMNLFVFARARNFLIIHICSPCRPQTNSAISIYFSRAKGRRTRATPLYWDMQSSFHVAVVALQVSGGGGEAI